MVLFHGRAGDVGDETCLIEIQRGQNTIDDIVGAGVLQTDCIQHAAGGFINAVWRIPETRFLRGTLQAYGTDIAVRESGDTRVFFTKTDAAGQ